MKEQAKQAFVAAHEARNNHVRLCTTCRAYVHALKEASGAPLVQMFIAPARFCDEGERLATVRDELFGAACEAGVLGEECIAMVMSLEPLVDVCRVPEVEG